MMNNAEQADRPIADVGVQRVARVYAEALLNAADKRGESEAVLEELAALVFNVFKANPPFETFLSSGVIGPKRKTEVLRSVFQHRASELFVNFLMVLNEHDRLDLLRPILASARELRDQRVRRMRVRVRSAVPLPDDQRERLQKELHESFQLEPLLEVDSDADLIGGLVVHVGDWLYDASVRTRLDNLRNQLIASSSYEIQSRRDRFSSANGD